MSTASALSFDIPLSTEVPASLPTPVAKSAAARRVTTYFASRASSSLSTPLLSGLSTPPLPGWYYADRYCQSLISFAIKHSLFYFFILFSPCQACDVDHSL
jgi:hypothetical protein